ncbi:MAG: hypothetical protein N2689_03725, partial [Verrucomicrobiae bacterium]|nr:hypothetical protein [Verrucomicrobiae bacterium]
MTRQTHTCFLAVVCAFLACAGLPAVEAATGEPVAWFRGGDQEFVGTNYYWLGQHELQLTFDVMPQVGHALELLWGSKNDRRAAVVVVNGQSLPVISGGDYSGFRWLRVPLPDGLKGCLLYTS